MLRHQLTSVQQKLKNLLDNFSYVQSKTLLKALEREFANNEQEKERLENKLASLQRRIAEQDSLLELAKQAENVLKDWGNMTIDEKQAVAHIFIERIVVSQAEKHRVADVTINWRDNSRDEFVLPYRADSWVLWSPDEVENLRKVIESGASQVEIAASVPTRNWRAIRIKVYEIIGERKFHISPKPIRDKETYEDYMIRVEQEGINANRTSGNRWTNEELEALEEAIENEATQLEIAAALPFRTGKLSEKLRGSGINVPETVYR